MSTFVLSTMLSTSYTLYSFHPNNYLLSFNSWGYRGFERSSSLPTVAQHRY